MSTLITYSTNDQTRFISKFIAKRINADLIEVKDLNKKTGVFNSLKDNYNALRLNKTSTNPKSIDIQKYDLILFGSPSQFGNPTPAMLSIIDNCDFNNKNIILYTTTNGKQGAKVLNTMKKKIEARGGIIVNSFILRVNNKTKQELITNTLKIIYELDLDLYI